MIELTFDYKGRFTDITEACLQIYKGLYELLPEDIKETGKRRAGIKGVGDIDSYHVNLNPVSPDVLADFYLHVSSKLERGSDQGQITVEADTKTELTKEQIQEVIDSVRGSEE